MPSWLACIDLDGTLLNKDSCVTQFTRDAIQRFRSEGNKVAIITGRHPKSTIPIKEACGDIDGVACFNGGWIAGQDGQLIHDACFSFMELSLIRDVLKGLRAPILWATDTLMYATGQRPFSETDQWLVPISFEAPPLEQRISKITILIENDQIRNKALYACERLSTVEWVESSPMTLDIMPGGQSKGFALEEFAYMYNIAQENTIAIGNYDNDISMLEKAHIGVAVANSSPELKKVATEYAAHHDDAGVANWLLDRIKTPVHAV